MLSSENRECIALDAGGLVVSVKIDVNVPEDRTDYEDSVIEDDQIFSTNRQHISQPSGDLTARHPSIAF